MKFHKFPPKWKDMICLHIPISPIFYRLYTITMLSAEIMYLISSRYNRDYVIYTNRSSFFTYIFTYKEKKRPADVKRMTLSREFKIVNDYKILQWN